MASVNLVGEDDSGSIRLLAGKYPSDVGYFDMREATNRGMRRSGLFSSIVTDMTT